jgi:hypothetical protein
MNRQAAKKKKKLGGLASLAVKNEKCSDGQFYRV